MRKKLLAGLVLVLFVFGLTGTAGASLVTIGTATYGGADYKLIWDNDNNGNSIVWLDYTNAGADWSTQTTWAAGLNGNLTYHIDATYTVTWDSAWRLPDTVDGVYADGCDGNTTGGYNITSSEMGHLFYDELGNLGYRKYNGTSCQYQSGYGLNNTGDFDNLTTHWYWSDTEYASDTDKAWNFAMEYGGQHTNDKGDTGWGLAVRSGQISSVPIPGALWLLGSGLFGLVAVRRRRVDG